MSALKKLMQARIALQGQKLSKSGNNKFAGYSYFELGDFLPQIQIIFSEIGLAGVVSYGQEVATLTITDVDDESSVVITSPMSTAALKGCHEVQNLGAVETYIRRYLWVTAMEIVEHDALDATTGKDEKKSSKSVLPGPISPLDGAIERLSLDQQTSAKDDADYIVKCWNEERFHEALDAYNTLQTGDQDYFLGVWAYLKPESKVRSGLKKMKLEQKEAA